MQLEPWFANGAQRMRRTVEIAFQPEQTGEQRLGDAKVARGENTNRSFGFSPSFQPRSEIESPAVGRCSCLPDRPLKRAVTLLHPRRGPETIFRVRRFWGGEGDAPLSFICTHQIDPY